VGKEKPNRRSDVALAIANLAACHIVLISGRSLRFLLIVGMTKTGEHSRLQ
jgi:hypothetical protein